MLTSRTQLRPDRGGAHRRTRPALALVVGAAVALGPLVLLVVVGVLVARRLLHRPDSPSSGGALEDAVADAPNPAVSTGPTQNYTDPDVVPRRARPALALAVRTAIAVGPLVLALVVGAVAALVVPPGRTGLPVWLWLVGVVIVTAAVLFVCSRLLRRLAPLSALLRLSLMLPDDVPHRFALARRRWAPEALEQSAAGARAGADGAQVGAQDGLEDGSTVHPSQRLLALVATLAAHDGKTRAHGERVQAYTALIGRELGLGADDVDRLSWAALLHDVGKVHVPVEVINKAGRPTDEEWAQLQSHPHHGGELVEPLRGWLGDWLDGVEQHHERWDGKGYPQRLAGEDISLAARIIAVADTYDVITSARAYKKPMTAEQARAEITRCAGAQFDPEVVRALLSVGIAKLRRVAGPATLLAALPVFIAAPAQAVPSVGAVLQAAGGHAATAVLAAGVGVTGGVTAADVIAAPPGAAVLVVQQTAAPLADTGGTGGGVSPHTKTRPAPTHTADVTAAQPQPPGTGAPTGGPSALPGVAGPTAGASTAPAPASSSAGAAPGQSASPPADAPRAAADVPRPAATRPSAEPPRASSGPAPVPTPSASRPKDDRPSKAPATPADPVKTADQVQKAAQDAARKAAETAAKEQTDRARAAQDAADKAAKQAAKDAADAADRAVKQVKDAAAAADKAAKQAADAAGKLPGGPTSGRTTSSSTSSAGPSSPQGGSSSGSSGTSSSGSSSSGSAGGSGSVSGPPGGKR